MRTLHSQLSFPCIEGRGGKRDGAPLQHLEALAGIGARRAAGHLPPRHPHPTPPHPCFVRSLVLGNTLFWGTWGNWVPRCLPPMKNEQAQGKHRYIFIQWLPSGFARLCRRVVRTKQVVYIYGLCLLCLFGLSICFLFLAVDVCTEQMLEINEGRELNTRRPFFLIVIISFCSGTKPILEEKFILEEEKSNHTNRL